MNDTSWEQSASWYSSLVGTKGHYYHKIILPKVLQALDLPSFPNPCLLDVGCGSGVLASCLPATTHYVGIDASPTLISQAKKHFPTRTFLCHDSTKPFPTKERFTHVLFMLSLQNMEDYAKCITHAVDRLEDRGVLLLVLNHPCFRIPRQTHWGIDPNQKIQYRRIDRYLSPLTIPISMDPSKNEKKTFSFHHCLQDLFSALENNHILVQRLQEIISDKQSTGKASKMENRARQEIPLFLLIKGRKIIIT